MVVVEPSVIETRSGREFTIRSAHVSDAAALLAYIRAVAAESPFLLMEADEFDFPEEQERIWIQNHLDRPGWIALMAEAAGEVLGVLSFENGPYRRTAHGGSFGVTVAANWRNQGIGTALIETLLRWAAACPLIDKVGMEVLATNVAALRLYKRLGFVEEGVKRKEIKLGPDRFVDAVVMVRFV